MNPKSKFRWEALLMAGLFTAALALTACVETPGSSASGASSSSSSVSSSESPSSSPENPASSDSPASSDISSSEIDPNVVNWLYRKNGENSVVLLGYDPDCAQPERVITLPDELGGYPVTEIASSAFDGAKFREVTIPASVKKVGNWAFAENTNLTKVTILGAETLGDAAFYCCSNLESLSLNDTITKIGGNTFAACHNLTSIRLPSKLKIIDYNAFLGAGLSGTLVIPDGVVSIGGQAFMNTSISEIVLPASLKTIGGSAFWGTTLSAVGLPEGLTEIESDTFGSCRQLQRVYIPASVKYINSDAFDGGSGCPLEDVYYGGSEAGWNQIDIATGNSRLDMAQKHYDAKPTDLYL